MDFPDARMIETNGIELEVFEAGKGGIPVVLCHGWPEHAYSWRNQIPALVDAGYHCIVPNQRGYGASSKPDDVNEYDTHHLTDDHVFVDSFEKGGFVAPCNWYRNFTRNWEITEGVEQKVVQPALMIYGKYDMVPQSDMSPYVADLEVHNLECGHWIQQEKPSETNEILISWLDRRMKSAL